MSETDSTKVVGLDFTVKDATSAPASRMAKSFEHISTAVDRVNHGLNALGHHTAISALGAVGLGIGFREIAEKAKEANLEIEDSTKKLAGMQYAFGHWRAGVSTQDRWNASLKEGEEVVERLEESEGKLKMGRSELAGIFKSATALGERYGLSMDQQLDLTEKLGAAEKVLGVNAEAAGMRITQMAMMGKIRGFDDFSKGLRFAIGDLKQFAKLSEPERFKRIQKAMGDLVPAAEAMGQGLAGSMFDMREAVEDVTRDVTGPVFKEVTKEFGQWARHMTQMRENGESLAKDFGDRLVTAFGYLKGATSFIADHWKSIALIWGANKALGAMNSIGSWGKAGTAGAAAGGATAGVMHVSASVVNVNGSAAASLGKAAGAGAEAAMKPGFKSVIGGMAGVASKALIVTEALTALYVGAAAAAKALDAHHDTALNLEANFGKDSALGGRMGYTITESMKRLKEATEADQRLGRSGMEAAKEAKAALTAYKAAYGPEVIAGGKVNLAAAREAYGAMDPSTRRQQMAAMGLDITRSTSQSEGMFAARLAQVIAELAARTVRPEQEALRITGKRDIKINVQNLEVTQDFKQAEPDRIFHRIPNDIAEMVLAPHASNLPLIPE